MGKRKSLETNVEEGMGPKTRAAVAWGTATSPGGTTHTFIANSGITPDGCSDTGKAVLRAAMKHPGVPGHSETSFAIVSDSPCSTTISPVKMSKRDCIFGAIRVASATATGQPYPIGHAHKVAHQRLWQQQGSGFWVWRACAAAWGARSRSNATGQEWIDLADRSIQSWRCEEMACNGHRGVNRGMGVGLWLSHVPRVRVRGHFTAL